MEIGSINDALKAMNRIEDKRDALRAAYETQERKLKVARDLLEQYLLQTMRDMGLQSFELPNEGVATIKTKRRFGAADWALVWDWVIEKRCPHMLQKRLLDSEIQKYLDDTGGLPPGVSTEARLTINVTKRSEP